MAHRISRSVVAKPHNVKRCSLAAEVQDPQDPGNPCQLRGTIAHEVDFVEARAQISGTRSRPCHIQTHTSGSAELVQKMLFETQSASSCAVCAFGATGAGGNSTSEPFGKRPRHCCAENFPGELRAFSQRGLSAVGGAQPSRAANFSNPARVSIPRHERRVRGCFLPVGASDGHIVTKCSNRLGRNFSWWTVRANPSKIEKIVGEGALAL